MPPSVKSEVGLNTVTGVDIFALFPDPLCAGPELGAGAVQRGRADPPPPGGLQRQRERGQGAPQLPSSAGRTVGLTTKLMGI